MEGARRKVMGFFGKQDNVMNLLLAGAFAALSWRSYQQQKEIDVLEAEKSALRSGNMAMSSTMWAWREHLFHLAESDPSSAPIPLARLRAIYGEEEKVAEVTSAPLDVDIRSAGTQLSFPNTNKKQFQTAASPNSHNSATAQPGQTKALFGPASSVSHSTATSHTTGAQLSFPNRTKNNFRQLSHSSATAQPGQTEPKPSFLMLD